MFWSLIVVLLAVGKACMFSSSCSRPSADKQVRPSSVKTARTVANCHVKADTGLMSTNTTHQNTFYTNLYYYYYYVDDLFLRNNSMGGHSTIK